MQTKAAKKRGCVNIFISNITAHADAAACAVILFIV